MEEIFADAFYWIALANPADQWHHSVKQFDEQYPDFPLVTTHEVLTEFLNYFAEAGNRRRKIVGVMCARVLTHPNITVIPQTQESFLLGLELYNQRPDKGYSLTDCISMALMRENGISKALTHDKHFAQEGFEILF